MPRRATAEELIRLLQTDQFAQILDIREDIRIEFKSQLNLRLPQDRHTLAKSVAAMVNSAGGVILVGVQTAKDIQSRTDYATLLTYAGQVDIASYYNILSTYLYPRPQYTIEMFGDGAETLLAIQVDAASSERPVLTTQTFSDTLNGGTIFGYYTRTQEGVQSRTYAEIHALLQAGQRMTAVGDLGTQLELIYVRLDSIESSIKMLSEEKL